MMTEWMDNIVTVVIVTIFIGTLLLVGVGIGRYSVNENELRQCLSQSGTTWKGGECVIIINKK